MTPLQPGVAGLPRLILAHPSGSRAELYLHGAHLTSWVPAGGDEALFLSRAARFGPGDSIRGGIPVIFPQFAELGPLPKHGLVRTQSWERAPEEREDEARAVLRLRQSDASLALWPHPFLAELRVELGADTLDVRLSVTNTGRSALAFTAALHTYLRVADVREAGLEGLRGVRHRSRAEGEGVDEGRELRFGGEVDRVYLDVPGPLRVHDRAGGRTLEVSQAGFRDVVVWNPWEARAAALPDMAEGEYLEMLCVEAAQVGEPVRLEPGAAWSGEQRLRAAPPTAG